MRPISGHLETGRLWPVLCRVSDSSHGCAPDRITRLTLCLSVRETGEKGKELELNEALESTSGRRAEVTRPVVPLIERSRPSRERQAIHRLAAVQSELVPRWPSWSSNPRAAGAGEPGLALAQKGTR